MDEKLLDTLIVRTAAGDTEALHQLYTLLKTAVFASANAILQDRGLAEDVLQETFIKVFQSAYSYRPGSQPVAWILRIARNTALSMRRKRKKEVYAEIPDIETTPGVDSADSLTVRQALAALSPAEREIVTLNALDGFSQRDIAHIVGLPFGSISRKYRKALEKLRIALSIQ